MPGGTRVQHVGASTYRSHDGKTWVLAPFDPTTPRGLRHTWRIKVNKANHQTFFVNQADPTKKVWELPEVAPEDAAAVVASTATTATPDVAPQTVFDAPLGSMRNDPALPPAGGADARAAREPTPMAPAPGTAQPRSPGLSGFTNAPPTYLNVACASNPQAEGRYQLAETGRAATPHHESHDTTRDTTLPMWVQVRGGGADGADARRGCLFANTRGLWVVGGGYSTGDAAVASPLWLESSVPHAHKLYPHELAGGANAWGYWFRGAMIPDATIAVTADTDGAPATPPPAPAAGSLDHLLSADGQTHSQQQQQQQWQPHAPAATPGSPEQVIVSGQSEYYLENDYWVLKGRTLEDKLHTWKLKYEKDGTRVFINPWTRTKLLALPDYVAGEDPAPATAPPPSTVAAPPPHRTSGLDPDALTPEALAQLDVLEAQLAQEHAALTRQAAQQQQAAPPQQLPMSPPPPAGPHNGDGGDAGRHPPLTAMNSVPLAGGISRASTALTITAPYASVLEAFERELADRKNVLEREAAHALETHQRYLRDRASALEQEHELETKRLQDAARHLETLTRSREADVPAVGKASAADVIAEQRLLQAEVNAFYNKTSEAVSQAKRVADEQKFHRGDARPPSPSTAAGKDDETFAGASSCEQPQSSVQEFLDALQQGKYVVHSRADSRDEATHDRKLASMQAALQQSMAEQMQAMREEFSKYLSQRVVEDASGPRDAPASAGASQAPPLDADAAALRDDLERMEQAMADLRVEHEAEKAELLAGAKDDVDREKEKLAGMRQKLAEALAENETLVRQQGDAGSLKERVDELRREVVKLKTEKTDEQDRFVRQLKDAAEALEQTRREKAAVQDELRNVKDIMRHEQRATLDAVVRDAEEERANLIAAHRRELEASEVLLHDAKERVIQTQRELDALRASAPPPHAASADVMREVEELKAELRVIKKENHGLNESLAQARQTAEAAQAEAEAAAAAAATAAAAKQPVPVLRPPSPLPGGGPSPHAPPQGPVDLNVTASPQVSARSQLKTFLEGEMGKLQAEYLDPPPSMQTRLKRFRERSASRSHSADGAVVAVAAPPSYHPRVGGGTGEPRMPERGASHLSSMRSVSPAFPPSPSPSPYKPPMGAGIAPGSQGPGDEMRRLRHLKEQIRHRLSAEQASTV